MSDNRMNFPYEGNEEQQHKNTNGFGVPSDGGWGVSSSRKEEKAQAEQEYQNISRENESIRCDMETAREENAKLKDRIRELEKLLGETG